MKKCPNCFKENHHNRHYCKYCGKNLTKKKELSDILGELQELFILLGLFGIFGFSAPLYACSRMDFCIDNSCTHLGFVEIVFISIPFIILLIGFLLKLKYKSILKDNLDK